MKITHFGAAIALFYQMILPFAAAYVIAPDCGSIGKTNHVTEAISKLIP